MRSWDEIIEEHVAVVEALRAERDVLEAIAETVATALRAGRRVYVLGNGGSAADAQHIAAEMVGRFRLDRPGLPVTALTTDPSILTAVSNDYGYAQVFARQVEALVQPDDVLWLLSTSGRSANVLAAAQAARQREAIVIGFTGRDGGPLAELCDHVLRVDHAASDRIQEAHVLAYHFVCERVEALLAGTSERS